MGDVYLVEALRTPFGAFGGALAEVGASQLAATVIKGLMAKTGLAGETVNEVIIGQVLSGGAARLRPGRRSVWPDFPMQSMP